MADIATYLMCFWLSFLCCGTSYHISLPPFQGSLHPVSLMHDPPIRTRGCCPPFFRVPFAIASGIVTTLYSDISLTQYYFLPFQYKHWFKNNCTEKFYLLLSILDSYFWENQSLHVSTQEVWKRRYKVGS